MTVELWDDLNPETYETPAEVEWDGVDKALEDANWHGRHLRRLHSERAQVKSMFAAEINRLTIALEQQLGRYDRDIAWHEAPIKALHSRILDADPKRKSIKLPNLTMRARAGQPRWEFDSDRFIDWAERNAPDLLRFKRPEIDRTAAKKTLNVSEFSAVDGNGEVVPGVAVLPAETSFSVELPEVDE